MSAKDLDAIARASDEAARRERKLRLVCAVAPPFAHAILETVRKGGEVPTEAVWISAASEAVKFAGKLAREIDNENN